MLKIKTLRKIKRKQIQELQNLSENYHDLNMEGQKILLIKK
jgi:hypothetical protein